jgi:hypothetical protein
MIMVRRRWIATSLPRRNDPKDEEGPVLEVERTEERAVEDDVSVKQEEEVVREEEVVQGEEGATKEATKEAEDLEMAEATAELEEKLRGLSLNLDDDNPKQDLDDLEFAKEKDYPIDLDPADTEDFIQ